jgi:hypothetical protein
MSQCSCFLFAKIRTDAKTHHYKLMSYYQGLYCLSSLITNGVVGLVNQLILDEVIHHEFIPQIY